ncbi:MAG: aminodeoxychorismate synthase component I [Desulfosalsimonadaceae bacterium]
MPGCIREWLNTHIGGIRGVAWEKLRSCPPFSEMAAAFSDEEGTVVLMSGGAADSARYHILAVSPWLTVKCYGSRLQMISGGRSSFLEADPFSALELILDFFAVSGCKGEIPVCSGLFGYLSYDLKNHIENLPQTAVNDLALPLMCFYAPAAVVVHDRRSGFTWRCTPQWEKPAPCFIEQQHRACRRLCCSPAGAGKLSFKSSGGLEPMMSKRYYLDAIETIKAYIRSGDIYQANFAQRFASDFSGSPFALFRQLFEAAPAPFYAYIHAGDHYIVSTSPERFIKQSGTRIETRPIKGTRPRGQSREQDQAMRKALLESTKDEAELSMIVDLLRNDFGRVSEGGSVRVEEHRRLEAYENVFHLLSVITGRLSAGHGAVDLIRASFPGGSITGCPRIRAMEIIDELEPCQRHIYTGSIGYISFHRSMDLSIAIRTATIVGKKLIFSVGGGIVWDSEAEEEYQETLHKGRSLADALASESAAAESGRQRRFVWHNGGFVPEDRARLPFSDLGVQYGFGFFETICVQNGAPAYLDAHIERFYRCWNHLFQTPLPDVDWGAVISRLIEKNCLSGETAAVKLMATRGSRNVPPYDHNLFVSARSYSPRPAITRNGGLRLAVYPHPRHTPLADFKTLNYLYYYLAGRRAGQQAADEALICNSDGSVSETHTGNILLIRKNAVVTPASSHVLAGVMQARVLDCLKRLGYSSQMRKLYTGDLFSSAGVIVTNSLIGAVPALSLDGKDLGGCSDLCRSVNRLLAS